MSEFNPPPQYAQYPRQSPNQQNSGEFDRPPGVYFDALGDAWTIVKRDLGTWVALALVAFLLSQLIAVPFQLVGSIIQGGGSLIPDESAPFNPGTFAIAMVLNLIGGSIGFPLYAGLYYAAIKQIRGEAISINDLFKGFSFFIPLALFALIYNLLLFLGALLCIVPMVFVLGALAPCALLIMDRGMSPIDAISESIRMLGNKAWLLGLFGLFAGLVCAFLGFLMCCVGLLVTMPVYFVAMALHYHYFWPTQQMQQAVYETPGY